MKTTNQPLLKLLRNCTLASLAVTLVQVAIFSLKWRMSTDQPLMFYLGDLMNRFGAVPYRDFFEMNPPGTPLVYAWIERLTGLDELLTRCFDLLLLIFLCRITATWMRPLGRAAGALGLLCFGFIYFGGGQAMSLEREFLLLIPVSLGILLATEGGRLTPAWRAATAGLCFGSAAMLKPHAALGLLPVLFYLMRKVGHSCREWQHDPRLRLRATLGKSGLLILSASAGFAIPVLLTAIWLYRNGALAPFIELVRNYWPIYQDLAAGMKILHPEERASYFFQYLRGMDGRSPWLIAAFIGAYAGMLHTEPGTDRRDRVNMLLQLVFCYLLYLLAAGKFWSYHFLPFFFFTSLLSGLCFMDLPEGTAPRHGWFMAVSALLGLYFSLTMPPEYWFQVQGYKTPAPKSGRPDMIAEYLKANMKPGDLVQPLDVTGGAVHGMLLARARLATPFIYDFHFYHHIYNDYTRVLRQRFIDAMVRNRPRFVIQVETEKPWVTGVDTTMTFTELTDLLRSDYDLDFRAYGVAIYKRKALAEGGETTPARSIVVTMPRRPDSRMPTPMAGNDAGPSTIQTSYDLCVYGGTSAGVTAAVAAARLGRTVVLVEPGWHLGGMTSGGLGATDYGNQETIGGITREFYWRVKMVYANPKAWKWERPQDYKSYRHDPSGDVMWHFEPHAAEQIFNDMTREAGVKVVLGERLDLRRGVRRHGPRIDGITMESGREFRARVYIDATYEGDLMARAGVSYHVGREANAVYGETINGVQTQRVPYGGHNFFRPVSPYVVPGDAKSGLLYGVQSEPPGPEGSGDRRIQAYCFRLCLTEVPENRVPFIKPKNYDPARYELLLRYLQTEGTDKLFPDHPKPKAIESPVLGDDPDKVIMPNRKTDSNTKGAISFNFVGGNYDYPEGDYAARERIIAEHRKWQEGLIWFVQNDPRVPAAYREPLRTWGLAKDEFIDNGHWPHQLYVREARRLIGEYVVTELDCAGRRRADDPVALGSYGMDSHVCERYIDEKGWVRNEGNLGGAVPKPYPISYRAITPRRQQCDNLLVPVCCSASHAGYGSIRMEPVYMMLGQAAGAAAALAIEEDLAVQALNYQALRGRLITDGQRLEWAAEN